MTPLLRDIRHTWLRSLLFVLSVLAMTLYLLPPRVT
jgi:hypothetical protein